MAAALVVTMVTYPAIRAQPQVNAGAAAMQRFSGRVQRYAALRRTLERRLPRLSPGADPDAIEPRQRALADAIRATRHDAKPGDIFGSAADQFRRVIQEDARKRTPRDASAAMKEVPAQQPPHVNAEYPREAALATVPPLILLKLQRLPDGLEYRFMGRDLILRDADANLIVDFIADAVPTSHR
jgi:hypothetical protein